MFNPKEYIFCSVWRALVKCKTYWLTLFSLSTKTKRHCSGAFTFINTACRHENMLPKNCSISNNKMVSYNTECAGCKKIHLSAHTPTSLGLRRKVTRFNINYSMSRISHANFKLLSQHLPIESQFHNSYLRICWTQINLLRPHSVF